MKTHPYSHTVSAWNSRTLGPKLHKDEWTLSNQTTGEYYNINPDEHDWRLTGLYLGVDPHRGRDWESTQSECDYVNAKNIVLLSSISRIVWLSEVLIVLLLHCLKNNIVYYERRFITYR